LSHHGGDKGNASSRGRARPALPFKAQNHTPPAQQWPGLPERFPVPESPLCPPWESGAPGLADPALPSHAAPLPPLPCPGHRVDVEPAGGLGEGVLRAVAMGASAGGARRDLKSTIWTLFETASNHVHTDPRNYKEKTEVGEMRGRD
jgi:hypothetical protein